MSRLVREYVEVGDLGSLDDLISRLTALRDALPKDAEAQARLRGDDYFGRHIAITYQRPLSAEEAGCESRYTEAGRTGDGLLAAA